MTSYNTQNSEEDNKRKKVVYTSGYHLIQSSVFL